MNEGTNAHRVRRFLWALVGLVIAIVVLVIVMAWFVARNSAVSSLRLDAAAQASANDTIPTFWNVSYAAQISGAAAPISGLPINLEDSGGAEFICENNQVTAQPAVIQLSDSGKPYLIRLTNRCDVPVSVKACWLDGSPIALFIPSSCTF